MKVKLSLLDRQETLFFVDEVPISIYEDGHKTIGICKVSKDSNGKHFGDLELEQDVSHDLYFYYRSMTNEAGIFIFSGLDFTPKELTDSRTTRLSEMIVG